MSVPKLPEPLVFDGKLNEPFWEDYQPLDMVMYQPVYKGEKSEEDEIYLVYDEEYVYLAARLYYDNTADIRANSLFRDQFSGDDTFALILDTFNDDENALWFFTNPAGTRFDVLISNDAEGRGSNNFDWNTFWDVKTQRAEWGWSVEMRVPFSSLGFQSEGDGVVMGVLIYRFLSKANERYVYPDNSPELDNAFRKPSLARKVRFTGIENSNPVYLRPYLLGGLEEQAALNPAATGFETEREWTRELGGDVKMNLTSNLTLDLTVNTDFAQVEADNEQVNLTRFPLFFPEKRQFFQERSSLFEFGFSRRSRLFHSRRIGLDNEGRPIRIYGGARLVGKVGETNIGLLNMQTADSPTLPSENFGVLRLKRSIFNRYSNIGAMFTSRVGTYQNDNYAIGLDAVIRVTGDEYMTAKLSQTYRDERVDPLDNARIFMEWERRRNVGLNYRFTFDRSGPDFQPEVGFTTRSDFTLLENRSAYGWLTDDSPIFQELSVGYFNSAYFLNDTGEVETGLINPFFNFNTKGGDNVRFQVNIRYENLLQPFTLSDEENITVPAGTYWYQDFELNYRPPNGWKFRPELELVVGGFFDGSKSTVGLSTEWNLSSHLEIANEYEFNKVRFDRIADDFNTHLARLRLKTVLNTQLSLTSFIQYSSEVEKVTVNGRFRYNFGEGNDLWIVYDNVINRERNRAGLPRLPISDRQALLVKFTYTFKVGDR
ncbi:MAG: DUF5916 domain-containing protein [Balneolaceae bacterium]|nr:DUF5916 domain-containing protein [Balneolaceae bacterium]